MSQMRCLQGTENSSVFASCAVSVSMYLICVLLVGYLEKYPVSTKEM